MSDLDFKPLRLKKRLERRLRGGHLWVYSNEIDTAATPLKAFEAGDPVDIQASNGKSLGTGYVNPNSLICARLMSRDPKHPMSASLLVHKLKIALALRERTFPQPFYRLVYGDSDELPGLVVDRFGDVLVGQITTAGMERMRDEVTAALDKVLKPRAIVWKNDAQVRSAEGLESYTEIVKGEIDGPITVEEGEARFSVDVINGQKTGWFYDQRDNRQRMSRYINGGRVLDLFSYVGGWGISAALQGAEEVVCVDSSQPALDRALAGAKLSGVSDRLQTIKGDAFDVLKRLRAEREHFDVVIIDPPAFIKRRKDSKAGRQAYHRLNQMAMQVLAKDGILVSCSCSFHMPRLELQTLMGEAARHVDREIQILEHGYQGPDHPMHPVIHETEYLKAIFARVRWR